MSQESHYMKYTQREWDRTVGYGRVPDEYKHEAEEIPQKPIKSHDSPKNKKRLKKT